MGKSIELLGMKLQETMIFSKLTIMNKDLKILTKEIYILEKCIVRFEMDHRLFEIALQKDISDYRFKLEMFAHDHEFDMNHCRSEYLGSPWLSVSVSTLDFRNFVDILNIWIRRYSWNSTDGNHLDAEKRLSLIHFALKQILKILGNAKENILNPNAKQTVLYKEVEKEVVRVHGEVHDYFERVYEHRGILFKQIVTFHEMTIDIVKRIGNILLNTLLSQNDFLNPNSKAIKDIHKIAKDAQLSIAEFNKSVESELNNFKEQSMKYEENFRVDFKKLAEALVEKRFHTKGKSDMKLKDEFIRQTLGFDKIQSSNSGIYPKATVHSAPNKIIASNRPLLRQTT